MHRQHFIKVMRPSTFMNRGNLYFPPVRRYDTRLLLLRANLLLMCRSTSGESGAVPK